MREQTIVSRAEESPVEEIRAEIQRDTYPSTALAYEYVAPAYQWAMQRADRMEDRLQAAVRGISAMTVAVPTFGIAAIDGPSSESAWFVWAVIAYLVAAIIGTVAQSKEPLRIVDPGVLHEKWLGDPPGEFRRQMTYFAGEDLRDNIAVINRRHSALLSVYVIGVIEVILWVLWLASV